MAIRLAPASVVTPFEYTTILWATGFDLVLWGMVPGGATFVGAGIVVATGLYIARREKRLLQETELTEIIFRLFRSSETLLQLTGTELKRHGE